jgi:uncharacterized damage-inducible protein DinB
MNADDFRHLYGFNRWANARILDASAMLAREQFVKTIPSSFPSVRDTLAHILAAEWIWLERWKGTSPKALLDAGSFPTLEALRERWRAFEREQRAFLESVRDPDLGKILTYVNTKGETWSYPLGRTIQHVANHSTYHRGQVTTMLRQLGAEPPPTDLLVFEDEVGSTAPADELLAG